jgi:hypothetical protein
MTYRRKMVTLCGLTISALIFVGSSLHAQMADMDRAALTRKVAENKKQLEQYTYLQTTKVFLLSKLRTTRVERVHYDPTTGEKIATFVSSDPPPQTQQDDRIQGGPIQRAIQRRREEIKDEVKDYIVRLTGLMKQYLPPAPDRIKADMPSANISVPTNGEVKITFPNYWKQGDQLTLTVDKVSKTLKDVLVTSTLDLDPVTFHVSFSQLPDGTNYPASTSLESPAKDLRILVTTSDYQK